jgi:hypothetical protein
MFPPFLISIIVSLLVAGVLLGLITVLPIDPTIRGYIRAVVLAVVAIWLIYILAGALSSGPYYPYSPSPHR